MKTIVLITMALFISCSPKIVKTVKTDEKGNLVGLAQKSDFQQPPFQEWFDKNYNVYQPDVQTVATLKPLLKNVEIIAVMGTWCGDSKREVPHFYKILDLCDYNYKNLTMITVDRSKKSPANEQAGLGITNVPTFIFYKNGKEINRYVEYPRETLEKDILKILKNEGYKHSYME